MGSILDKIIAIIERVFKGRHKAAPAIGSGTQFWYGRVNWWGESQALLAKEVRYMKSLGVTGYIIEMAGWGTNDLRLAANSSQYKKAVAKCKENYEYLHKLCKQYGIWLFVCIVNDNALESKHGNKPIDPKHYYGHVATDLFGIVLARGGSNVVVQPVSELHPGRVANHPGVAWQRAAVSKLRAAGFLTCNNDNYGRPSGYSNCDYKAWHPNTIAGTPGGNTDRNRIFIVSDTGTIISELNGGAPCDRENADCNPAKVKEWRRKCNGFAVCGYYDYARRTFNKAAIRAMGGAE